MEAPCASSSTPLDENHELKDPQTDVRKELSLADHHAVFPKPQQPVVKTSVSTDNKEELFTAGCMEGVPMTFVINTCVSVSTARLVMY